MPQTLTRTATVNSGSSDMSKFLRAIFLFETGTFGGTSPTLSAVLQIQESADNATWSNNATIPSATVTTAGSQATQEVRSNQLGLGKRYVRLQVVCTVGGTSPTIPIAVIGFGDEANHKPGSAENDASVVSQTVVNQPSGLISDFRLVIDDFLSIINHQSSIRWRHDMTIPANFGAENNWGSMPPPCAGGRKEGRTIRPTQDRGCRFKEAKQPGNPVPASIPC